MDVITRKEAVERGLKHYFTGEPCKYGHVDKRAVGSGTCYECNRQWKKTNRDKVRQTNKRWIEKNREAARAHTRKWDAANRKKRAAYYAAWKKKNRDRVRAWKAQRRAAEAIACPSWVSKECVERVYRQAVLAERVTGLDHNVDHIVPLRGENVCGLHVPWNLQVLEATENRKKGNRF